MNRRSKILLRVALIVVAIAVAHHFSRRGEPARTEPAKAGAREASPAPKDAPPAPTKPAAAPEQPWELAGTTTADGETLTVEKRGDERRTRRKDGALLEQYLEHNGLREGPSSRWHASGNLESLGEWRAGKKDGAWTFFAEDGSLAQKGAFAAGLRTGPWENFYPDGKLRWRGSYDRDRQVGTWAFVDPSGEARFNEYGSFEDAQAHEH